MNSVSQRRKGCDGFKLWIALLTFSYLWELPGSQAAKDGGAKAKEETGSGTHHKLLIILLDGFRWDYYSRQKGDLPGFTSFLQQGVQAEYMEPVFPYLSYPSWTSISTGVYPETHGILTNFMFDMENQVVFDSLNETSTRMEHWWHNAEPIWTTATRHGRRCSLRYWSRCDVPFKEIKPEVCLGYTEVEGVEPLKESMRIALDSLEKGFDLVMTYTQHIDHMGHKHGPDSAELKEAVLDVDHILQDLLHGMADSGLDQKVNVIIVGDHGMKYVGSGSNVTFPNLDNYVNASDVDTVLEVGPVIAITPYPNRIQQVYERLKREEGFDVYLRHEIPIEFHFKNNRLVRDILVVTHPNYFIRGLQNTPKQIPQDPLEHQRLGTHGFHNSTEMRTIFFAKGPGFRKGIVHPPIQMVDVYQIFAHLLDIPAQPHNGSWSRVEGMLANKSDSEAVRDLVLIVVEHSHKQD